MVVTSTPSRSTRPPSHGTNPEIMSNRVVLPAPLGPITPRISRWCRARSTSSTAVMPPKRLRRPFTSSTTGRSPLLSATTRRGARLPLRPLSPLTDAAPSRKTDRSTSGRFSRSPVGPLNRISPFSMKYAVSATVRATFTDCSTRMIVVPRSRIAVTISNSCSTIVGASPSDSSSIISRSRLGDEGLRQREHLLLAARQIAGRLIPTFSQHREEAEHLLVGGLEIVAVAEVQPPGDAKVLGHGEAREHTAPARHLHDAPARHFVRRRERHVLPVEHDGAGRRGQQPEMARSKVDLPAPFVPRRATISPASTSKLTPNNTCTPS